MVRVLSTIQNFISKEALSGVLLFITTVVAVIIANSSLSETYYEFWKTPLGIVYGDINISMSLTHWINDGLMALFFLMVGLEIKREMIVGELSTFQKASFPVFAAIGGMLIPALIYISFNPSNPFGFGVPMATDIAFALGILMLLGSKVHSAVKLFLVTLAVVDDLGAILVVAIFYTQEIHWIYFIHVGIIYAILWLMNVKGVKALTPYLILGIFLWIYIHAIGIHATIAGVLLAFAIPIKSKIQGQQFLDISKKEIENFESHTDNEPIVNNQQVKALESINTGLNEAQSPLIKLEHSLLNFSAFFIMPLFAFSNAGVIIDFGGVSEHLSIVLGVIFGLVVGKPIGIFLFTFLITKFTSIKKPASITWMEILAVGFLAGIGFTMSIFITHLAFLDAAVISAVKLAIFIASFTAAVIGVIMLLNAHKKKEVKL